jgi:hypothetical protein
VRVHLAAEHAPQLKTAHLALEKMGVRLDVARRGLVGLALGHGEDLNRIVDGLGDAVELLDLPRQARAFASELLRPLGLRPQLRIFEFAADFLQAFLLLIVLKETPVMRRCALRGRAAVV